MIALEPVPGGLLRQSSYLAWLLTLKVTCYCACSCTLRCNMGRGRSIVCGGLSFDRGQAIAYAATRCLTYALWHAVSRLAARCCAAVPAAIRCDAALYVAARPLPSFGLLGLQVRMSAVRVGRLAATPQQRYRVQLQKLQEMGFSDECKVPRDLLVDKLDE